MAKAKSGGTRSYLRGRIANDVYSIGKDAKGKKQQVVRSLAESVANPQTIAQMRGRMIMSTVMQAVSALSPIIDHSFDNVAAGQPSISEFIRRNYALIKDDVATHADGSGALFGLNKYQEKGIRPGSYLISDGKAVLPFSFGTEEYPVANSIQVTISEQAFTAAQLREALGLGGENYITFVGVGVRGSLSSASDTNGAWVRLRWSGNVSDETVITSDNLESCFVLEASDKALAMFFLAGAGVLQIEFSFSDTSSEAPHRWYALGVIYSQEVEGGYQHSKSAMVVESGAAKWSADVALPTYPVGQQRFLNGGEL